MRTAMLMAALILASCGGAENGSSINPISSKAISDVSIEQEVTLEDIHFIFPPSDTRWLSVGDSLTFYVLAEYSDGTIEDVSDSLEAVESIVDINIIGRHLIWITPLETATLELTENGWLIKILAAHPDGINGNIDVNIQASFKNGSRTESRRLFVRPPEAFLVGIRTFPDFYDLGWIVVGDSVTFNVLAVYSDDTFRDITYDTTLVVSSNPPYSASVERVNDGWRFQALAVPHTGETAIEVRWGREGFPLLGPSIRIVDRQDKLDTRSIESEFDNQFWRDLIYNDWDRPFFDNQGPLSTVLSDPSTVDFVLDTDGWPDELDRDVWISWMENRIPILIDQMTGEEWQGTFEIDSDDVRDPSIIKIGFHSRPTRRVCGWASISRSGGRVYRAFSINSGRPRCLGSDLFPTLFAHELGHTFGLWHTGHDFLESGVRPASIMHPGSPSNPNGDFSPTDQYHSRLAYEIGPDRPYCGWPFGKPCQDDESMVSARRIVDDTSILIECEFPWFH